MLCYSIRDVHPDLYSFEMMDQDSYSELPKHPNPYLDSRARNLLIFKSSVIPSSNKLLFTSLT
jgi:hypothetical protein